MQLPAGKSTIELRYSADLWDWLGRLMTLAAMAGVVWWLVRSRRTRRAAD